MMKINWRNLRRLKIQLVTSPFRPNSNAASTPPSGLGIDRTEAQRRALRPIRNAVRWDIKNLNKTSSRYRTKDAIREPTMRDKVICLKAPFVSHHESKRIREWRKW